MGMQVPIYFEPIFIFYFYFYDGYDGCLPGYAEREGGGVLDVKKKKEEGRRYVFYTMSCRYICMYL